MTVPILSYRHATGRDRLVVDLKKLVAAKLLLQAASGGGKSWAIRQLCEELFGLIPQIIIDPEGEFHTLRERHDYVLVAVRGGDIEASPKTAALLARRLVELSASAVIDLSEMKPTEQRQFVRRFLEAMLALPRTLWHPTLVVVDEFHIFAPESGHGEAESLDACSDFSARARKRGFCLVGATTRIAKLHKDVAGNLHNKLIGFNSLDVDIDRAAKELGFDKEHRATIRQLEPGTFYAYGPAISKEVTLVRTGPVKSTHPEPGTTVAVAAVPASAKVKALIASSLADLPKEAEEEARTIDDLRRANADLSKKLRTAEKAAPAPKEGWVSHATMTSQINASVSAARRESADIIVGLRRNLQVVARDTERQMSRLIDIPGELARIKNVALEAIDSSEKEQRPLVAIPRPVVRRVDPAISRDRTTPIPARTAVIDGVTAPQQRILNALAGFESMGIASVDKSVVAVFSEQSPTSSGYSNNLGRLRTMALIDYPTPGYVSLTDSGRAGARGLVINSIDELHAAWEKQLPTPQWNIVAKLIDAYPEAVHREALADQAGQSSTSSGYSNNLGRLRTLGLIGYTPGQFVYATDLLFPEGLR